MAGFNDWLDVTDPKLMAETIAERFRLSQNELLKAQDALAPAFALGLQRAMATPKAWSDLAGAFSAMMPGAGSATATAPGEAFLNAFFGSDALTGAVARQASLFAGIAPDTIQKLMPSLAAITMETMVRATMANLQRNQPQGLATGDFGGATAEMMRRGANAVEALSRPSDAPAMRMPQPSAFAPDTLFSNAFSDAMKTSLSWMQGMSGAAPETPKERTPAPQAFDPMLPFAAMFDAFAKGMQGGAAPAAGEGIKETPVHRRAEADAPAPPPVDARPAPMSEEAATPADDMVGEMMRSGQKFQEDYAKEMANLFDRYHRAAS